MGKYVNPNSKSGPPRPGLVWSSNSHRWVRPRAGAPGQTNPVNSRTLQRLSTRELGALRAHARSKLQHEKDQSRFNDLVRVLREASDEVKRRQVNKVLEKAARVHRRMSAEEALEGVDLLLKGLSVENAIPVEQIKGDIARAGHQVKSIVAIDPEAGRLFFMSGDDTPLYAAFGGPDAGFALQKVGPQVEIAKEYDPVDLKADPDDRSNLGETVITEHEERDYEDSPGMVPAGTPGEKPKHDEQSYEDHGYYGEGLGDEGFGEDERHAGRRDQVKSLMGELDNLLR